jgi:hypothetical protein
MDFQSRAQATHWLNYPSRQRATANLVRLAEGVISIRYHMFLEQIQWIFSYIVIIIPAFVVQNQMSGIVRVKRFIILMSFWRQDLRRNSEVEIRDVP